MTVNLKSAIQDIFDVQKANQHKVGLTTVKERKAKLKAIKNAVANTYRQDLRDALYADLKKPQAEADLTEIYAVTSEINHALKHLNEWMSDRYVTTPLAFLGSSSYIKYQPKGVCLIISPWNFPLNLTFGPLVSAIAAGNTVIIKPSEFTPNTSRVMKKIVNELFSNNEVEVFEGDADVATELLSLPFNHIFFTGAPEIGKIVMKAAAKHLASVTLELGGKSPTIVDETVNVKTVAKRLAWGKFINSGQICIAPDYVYVHESKKETLIAELKNVLNEFYEGNPLTNDSYCSIINERHTQRVGGYLQDAIEGGAEIAYGGEIKENDVRISPTLLTNVPKDSKVMTHEIFGPLLPILAYKDPQEVIQHINSGEKPLSLYIYSKSNKNIQYFLDNTRAGSSCVNNNDMQFLQPYLPFGGDNNSGIGKAHGKWGFMAFTNERSVYRQHIPSLLEKLMPPYKDWKNKAVEMIVKWF